MSHDLRILFYQQPNTGGRGTTKLINLNNKDIENKISFDGLVKGKKCIEKVLFGMYNYTCKGIVTEEYLKQQLVHNTIIMVLIDMDDISKEKQMREYGIYFDISKYEKEELVGKPLAFLLGHYSDEYNDFYLDIICAEKNGGLLIKFFENIAEINESGVALKAIPTVLAYYPKLGYSHRKTCSRRIDISLPDRIESRDKSTYPTDLEDAYDDEDFANYMIDLRAKGYGVLTGDCRKLPLTQERLKSGDCGSDGYLMRKCYSK